jgi:hypothetical protein
MATEQDPLLVRLVPTATVAGTVRNPLGETVAGAEVKATRGQAGLEGIMKGLGEWKRDIETDERGRFRISSLLPGSISLTADAADWAPGEAVALELVGGETIEDIELRLIQGGTLTGEIFDSQGKPAASRMITVQDTTTYVSTVTTSSAQGEFRVEHLAPGPWQVIAMDTGSDWTGDDDAERATSMLKNMKMAQVRIVDGEETHVVLGGAPVDPVRVHGRVTHLDRPYSGAMVSFYGEGPRPIERMALTTVDKEGRYEVQLEGSGYYVVSVAKMSGEPGQQSSTEFPCRIPAGPEYRLDLEMPQGRISGRVFGPDGKGLARARITLTPDGVARSDSLLGGQYSEITTEEDGRYDLPGLRAGVYRISAGGTSFMGLGAESTGGRLTRGGLRLDEKQWLQDIDFRLEAPGTLEVHVRNAGGAITQGATIFVRDGAGRIVEAIGFRQTDGTGTCMYSGLAPGEYSAIARLGQESSEESTVVRVRPGASTRIDLQLGEGAIIWVRFRLDGGEEVPSHIEVKDSQGRDVTGLLGLADIQELYSEGSFSPNEHRIGPVPPGKYKVRAWTDDGRSAHKNIVVDSGEREKRFTLRLEAE